ncbi:MAG: FAD-dependent oxidoreductase, partial [Desulfobacterales bacterium]|nr:FAD-dependent oxidoreductase [Desulfobacterales bacterium]
EVCQQVCFHPERAKIDTSQITNLTHKYGESEEIPPSKSGAQRGRIVIIGSGPAGLTAGQELARRRYQVIVFESLPKPGGMLRACMPSYRLSRDILDSEIEHIENLGVEIRTGVTIGKDLTIADLLQEGYQALFIATGAHKTRELSIDGIHLNGVTYALDFLRKVNRKEKAEVGERVCVIGGGNVAMDAARTALREGAKAVCILYRRSREEMPANPWEVKEAESEGVKIRFLTSPRKILGKKGQVTAIECVRTELGELDESGRRRPRPIEGSEFVEECDMVMVAIGEKPDLSFLPGEIEVGEK